MDIAFFAFIMSCATLSATFMSILVEIGLFVADAMVNKRAKIDITYHVMACSVLVAYIAYYIFQ